MKRILTFFLMVLLFSLSQARSGWAAEQFVPNTLLDTVAGESLRLSDFKGKILVVNFWATWCPPCIDEIPELVRFQKEFASSGVQVIGIDFMEKPNRKRLAGFKKKYGMNYPVVFGKSSDMQKLAKAMGGVFGLPVTKFVDRKGKIINSHVGGVTIHQLRAYMHTLLSEK
jgi:thiol-disulfide isomerase/thioredoxin